MNANQSSRTYYYAKVGFSNSLLPFTKNLRSRAAAAERGLWFGFGSDHVDAPSDPELRKLLNATEANHRDSSVLFSFGRQHLYFFKPLGPCAMADQTVLTTLIKDIEASETYAAKFARQSHQNVKSKSWRDVIRGKVEEGHPGAKVLPVELLAVFSRDQLLPTVNSLSVYQALSRGTFRSIAAIGRDRDPLLGQILRPLEGERASAETWYGFFFHKYFDWILHARSSAKFDDHLRLDRRNSRRLLFATLNPVQIEAAASLLCLDLGLIVDFFTANSLDVIDVRARVPSTLAGRDRDVFCDELIANLGRIGITSTGIENKVRRSGTLEIQCKAAAVDGQSIPSDTLLFHPAGRLAGVAPRANEITLESLDVIFEDRAEWARDSHLARWLRQLEAMLFSKPEPIEADRARTL